MKNINIMLQDIVSSASSVQVEAEEEKVKKILSVYQKIFEHPISPVSFRTTTKDGKERGFNIRYVDFWVEHDPLKMALNHKLLVKTDHPIFKLYEEILSKYTIMGYGLDFGVDTGIEKIWMFFSPHLLPRIDTTFQLETLPESVEKNADFFQQFQLFDFSLFGLDFLHHSVNIYFMNDIIGTFDKETVISMFNYLGFELPSDEIITHCTKASTFYCTYSWESNQIERICFGILEEGAEAVPAHFNPLIANYIECAKFLDNKKSFIYSLAFTKNSNYIKIENDYSCSMVEFMKMNKI